MNLFGNPEKSKNIWYVSGNWMNKKVNCCLSGILNECGGCCHGKPGWTALKVYPMRAFGDVGMCGFYEEGRGCKFPIEERPLLCLMYPFMLDGNNMLVMYWRVLGGSCKNAYNTQDTPIFEHFKNTWIHLFGVDQYERVHKDLIVNKKPYSAFYPSEELLRVYDLEISRYDNNIIPEPRSGKI